MTVLFPFLFLVRLRIHLHCFFRFVFTSFENRSATLPWKRFEQPASNLLTVYPCCVILWNEGYCRFSTCPKSRNSSESLEGALICPPTFWDRKICRNIFRLFYWLNLETCKMCQFLFSSTEYHSKTMYFPRRNLVIICHTESTVRKKHFKQITHI